MKKLLAIPFLSLCANTAWCVPFYDLRCAAGQWVHTVSLKDFAPEVSGFCRYRTKSLTSAAPKSFGLGVRSQTASQDCLWMNETDHLVSPSLFQTTLEFPVSNHLLLSLSVLTAPTAHPQPLGISAELIYYLFPVHHALTYFNIGIALVKLHCSDIFLQSPYTMGLNVGPVTSGTLDRLRKMESRFANFMQGVNPSEENRGASGESTGGENGEACDASTEENRAAHDASTRQLATSSSEGHIEIQTDIETAWYHVFTDQLRGPHRLKVRRTPSK